MTLQPWTRIRSYKGRKTHEVDGCRYETTGENGEPCAEGLNINLAQNLSI